MDQGEMIFTRGIKAIACCAMILLLADCKNAGTGADGKGGTASPASSASVGVARPASGDIKQRLQHCTTLLMESLQKPTASYHFSYKAQENINPKFPMDKTAKPEVGPV